MFVCVWAEMASMKHYPAEVIQGEPSVYSLTTATILKKGEDTPSLPSHKPTYNRGLNWHNFQPHFHPSVSFTITLRTWNELLYLGHGDKLNALWATCFLYGLKRAHLESVFFSCDAKINDFAGQLATPSMQRRSDWEWRRKTHCVLQDLQDRTFSLLSPCLNHLSYTLCIFCQISVHTCFPCLLSLPTFMVGIN